MPELNFSLKVVSPAFIAGGEEEIPRYRKGKPVIHRIIGPVGDGLRIPSLRGVLRFWFRAKNGHMSISQLKTAEGKVFGDTNIGQGIKIIPTSLDQWDPQIVTGSYPEVYMGYGPMNHVPGVGGTSHNTNAHRDAIPPNKMFHFRAIGNDVQVEELKRCLCLLHLFGGVGSRSRRGWGALAVMGDFMPPLKQGESVTKWFKDVLKDIWINSPKPSSIKQQPSFSTFYEKTEIRISQSPFSTYSEVINEFYQRFKKVRLYNIHRPHTSPALALNDHNWEVRDSALTQDIHNVPLRLAFGMPYHPQSRRNNWDIEYFGYVGKPSNPGKFEKIDRRSSPLFLKVFEAPNQNLYAVSLFLRADFFGKVGVVIGKNENGNKLTFPGWKAVEDFLQNPKWESISLP